MTTQPKPELTQPSKIDADIWMATQLEAVEKRSSGKTIIEEQLLKRPGVKEKYLKIINDKREQQ